MCRDRLVAVFETLGVQPPRFQAREGNFRFVGEFLHDGRKYRIEIYDQNVVMHQDGRYYECYMPEEFKSEDSLIQGFATRLERFLSGGPWEGPNEASFAQRLVGWVKAVFR